MDLKKDKMVRELMNDAIVAMAKLKEISPDYWRVVLIALTNEEKKDREKMTQRYSKKNQELDIRNRMIEQIHDAMFELMRSEEPISKESICSWVLMDDEVRGIINKMPVDQFNTVFSKMYDAVKKEMEEG